MRIILIIIVYLCLCVCAFVCFCVCVLLCTVNKREGGEEMAKVKAEVMMMIVMVTLIS